MREIPLTQGLVALVDDEDFEPLTQYRWYAHRGCHTFYADRKQRINVPPYQKSLTMHRELLQALSGQEVDHIDGDGLNNQRANLRLATTSQNQSNRAMLPNNTSGRRGVSWHRRDRRWRAAIGQGNKVVHLGLFIDLDDAARAYDLAARSLFGEFARPNFPSEVYR